MIIKLYLLFTYILYFISLPFSIFISKNSKIQERLLLQSPQMLKKSIWLHGASVGEIMSASNLISKLHKQYPDYSIVITSHTATSKHIVNTQLSSYAKHHYLPYDCPYLIKQFIKNNNIKLALWLEQELFIATLKTIKQCNIPLLLLNARMSDKSFKRWSLLPHMLSSILNNFTYIFPMSLKSYQYFNQFSSVVQFLGNLKYTNNKFKLKTTLIEQIKTSFQGKQLFVALSTHDNEETQIAHIHNRLSKQHPNLVTLIIPRHPNRCVKIYQEIHKFYPDTQIYSNRIKNAECSLYIINTIGETQEFCAEALITFVGKSLTLKHQGGHNPLEPVFLSSCTIFGKYMQNFSDITADLLQNKSALQVNNYNELEDTLNHLLNNQNSIQTVVKNSKALAQSSDTIINKYLNKIICYLP